MAAGVLLAFDDINVSDGAGGLGRSPAWFPLVLAGVLLGQSESTVGVRRVLLATWSYGALLTAATLPFIPDELRGEIASVKGLKVSLTIGIWLSVLMTGWKLYERARGALFVAGVAACLVLLVGMIPDLIAVNLSGGGDSVLHATENIQQRVRGTRFEASSLGAAVIVCSAVALLSLPGRKTVCGFLVVCWGIFVLGQSRGTALTVVVVTALAAFVLLSKPTRPPSNVDRLSRFGLATAAVGLFLSFALGAVVTSDYWSDLRAATSDATRAIWAEVSLKTLVAYPLGQGYAGPLEWTPELLRDSIGTTGQLFPTKDLAEASGVADAASDTALSPKTIPGIATMYLGIPGLVLAAVYLYRAGSALDVLRSDRPGVGLAAAAFALITTSYFASPFSWEQPLLLGALLASVAQQRQGELR